MHPILRAILAVIAGAVIGSMVNMGIVMIGPQLIQVPPGVDMTTAEGIKAALPLLQPRHYLMPFLAHALGTLAGAVAAAVLARDHARWAAAAIGLLFLAGGIAASQMIPAPTWFITTDLLLAYGPMAALGWWWVGRPTAPATT